jgi:hypothetical protein
MARALCSQDSLLAELVFLRAIFRQNCYKDRQIHDVLNRRSYISKTAAVKTSNPTFQQIVFVFYSSLLSCSSTTIKILHQSELTQKIELPTTIPSNVRT